MPATAQSVRSGDITVYYNAMPTSALSPDIARQYGITRSSSRALLHVALRAGVPGKDRAVPATVTANATDSIGKRQALSLREVKEGEDVYYLAETRIAGNAVLKFEIEARPVGGGKPIRATFRQEFFVQ